MQSENLKPRIQLKTLRSLISFGVKLQLVAVTFSLMSLILDSVGKIKTHRAIYHLGIVRPPNGEADRAMKSPRMNSL